MRLPLLFLTVAACVVAVGCAPPPRASRQPVRVPFMRPAPPEPPGPPHAEFFNLNAVTPFHDVARGDEDAWEVQRQRLELAAEAGVHSVRTDLWWSMIEPEQGEWDWSVADPAIETINEAGLEPFPILAYASAWSETPEAFKEEEERERFAEYARQAARRYRDSVTWFEAWNEPNIPPFWTPRANPSLYHELFTEASEQVRKAHSGARIVGMSTAGPDTAFMESAYQEGAAQWTDAVSFHHYSSELDEWVLKEEIRRVRRLMDRYGDGGVPLWITESGQSTMDSNVVARQSEEDQASWIVKKHLVALAAGVERFYYYKLQDDPPERDPDGGWGLISWDGTPKPSWHAYRTMVSRIASAEFIGRAFGTETRSSRRDEAEVQIYRDAAGQPFAVAWVRREGPDATILLPSDTPVIVDGIDGETLDEIEPEEDGFVRVRLSNSPRYIRGLSEHVAALAGVHVTPAQLYISPGETRTLRVSFSNPLDHTVEIPLEPLLRHSGPAGLTISGEEDVLTVRAGEEGIAELTVELALDAAPFEPIQIRTNDGNGISYQASIYHAEAFELDLYAERPDGLLMVGMDYRNLTAEPLAMEARLEANGETLMDIAGGHLMAPGMQRSMRTAVELQPGETTVTGSVVAESGPRASERLAIWAQPFRDDRPTIDGSLEEWEDIEAVLIRPERHQSHPPRAQRALDAEEMSAKVRLWWTEDTLYVGAEIFDATPWMNPFRNNNLWRGDSLELYLGFDGPSRSAAYGPGDFQIGLSPGQAGNDPFVWNWVPLEREGEPVPAEGLRIESAEIATERTEDGYTLEAAIPLSEFGATVAPESVIGFTMHLNNRQNPTTEGRGWTLIWSGTHQNWRNPSGWGVAVIDRPEVW